MHICSPLISQHSAIAMNHWLDKAHGYYGQYMYNMPAEVRLRILGFDGKPLEGATVKMYQYCERPGQGQVITNQIKAQGATNAKGEFVLPNVPIDPKKVPPTYIGDELHDNPFGYLSVVGTNGLLHFRVEYKGGVSYAWLDITEVNVAYFKGQKDVAVFERQLCLGGPVQTCPPEDMTELNATGWSACACPDDRYAWADASAPEHTYVKDDTTRKSVGNSSLKLVTDSGYDTYVRYPCTFTANWNLTGATHLTVSFFATWGYGFTLWIDGVGFYPNDIGSWRVVAPMPTVRDGLAAVALSGKVYVLGGEDGKVYPNAVYEYTPETDSWHAVAPMPTARYVLDAVALNGKIYAVGGWNGNNLNTVEEYTPETNSWRAVAPMPTARRDISAVALNGKIYAIGGQNENNNNAPNVVEEYTPETNSWRAVAPMLTARASLAAAVLNGKIYAIGGSGLSTVEEYTPETNSWRMVTPMLIKRSSHAAAVLNGKIYVMGGNADDARRTVEEYTPETNSWCAVTPMPTAREHLAATTLNGKIYAIGGYNNGNYLSTVEEYTPPCAYGAYPTVTDTTPPAITSGPTVSDITSTSAVVKWNTDEASSSVVEYGVKPGYGLTAKGKDNVTEHSVSLASLSSNTTYYYRVGSTDASGNTVWSEQKTFKTLAEAGKRTLSITSVSASPGDKVTISISITDATGLAAGDILVKYDANVLTVGEVKGTDMISSLNLVINKDVLGEIKLPMAGTKGIPSGSGALVEIELTVSKDAKVGTETKIEFGDTEIYDESGAVIPVILENGVVKITQQGIKGDVNNDGKVRSNDAMLALRIAAGLMEPTDYQKWAADMNDDGKIRSNDAMLILRKAAGLAAPDIQPVATGSGEITVMLGEAHGVAGERITVPLMVDNIPKLASGDICIAYDSAVLRAVEVSSDSEALLQSNLAETGMIRIAFAGADGLNSKTVAKIQFDILSDDVSPLTLQQVELYQSDALLVDSRKIDGLFSSWAIPPEHSALLQNFPNPFNPETWIPYQLAEGGDVTIRIYNIKGQLIKTLDLGYQPAGIYTHRSRAAYWDGKNEQGDRVASGIYFYQLRAGQFSAMRKLILLK
jgi:N-acetylneuraminic acid mutarotase